jgi:phosphatidylserine/phosphatidylglycerophosphate/cardiolipin synthase-like enzyme
VLRPTLLLALAGSVALGVCACSDRGTRVGDAPWLDPTPGAQPGEGDDAGAGVDDAGSPPTPVDAGPGCSELSPRAVPAIVSAWPDAGETPLVDVINAATSSLRIMIYELADGGPKNAILAKARAGVDVRVILDKGQDASGYVFNQLQQAGAKVKYNDPKFQFMHAKTVVADDKIAFISSGNFGGHSIGELRDFVARVEEPKDVAVLASVFDADWQQKTPDVSCTRLLFSPVNARQRLLNLIRSAKKTLLIESMQFQDTQVRQEVVSRKKAGVDVRFIGASAGWIDANAEAAQFLAANGIPAKWISGCHAKAIVVDGATAYIGSENLSWTSLDKNREAGLVLTTAGEPAAVKFMNDTLEADWARGRSY